MSIYPDDRTTLHVCLEHDLARRLGRFAEELHENVNHELLRRVVIVMEYDTKHRRPPQARPFEDRNRLLQLRVSLPSLRHDRRSLATFWPDPPRKCSPAPADTLPTSAKFFSISAGRGAGSAFQGVPLDNERSEKSRNLEDSIMKNLFSRAPRPMESPAVRRILIPSLILLISGIFIPEVSAEVNGACRYCGTWVVLDENGAGFARDWVGTCGGPRCRLLEAFDENNFEESGIRYLHLEDGTKIDLQHFLAAVGWERRLGEAGTNIAGWLYEVMQAATGNESGHPLGGNEDLASNAAGADFGNEHLDPNSSSSLPEQILEYLEARHGPLTHVGGRPGKK